MEDTEQRANMDSHSVDVDFAMRDAKEIMSLGLAYAKDLHSILGKMLQDVDNTNDR